MNLVDPQSLQTLRVWAHLPCNKVVALNTLSHELVSPQLDCRHLALPRISHMLTFATVANVRLTHTGFLGATTLEAQGGC